jgi:hypothetical protein
MDNRNNPIEDFQSTPEHLANQVGGPGFTKANDPEAEATPGSLRQVMLESEHDAKVAREDQAHSSYSSVDPRAETRSPSSSNAVSQYEDTATADTWRTRMSERVRTMRTRAEQHPVALAVIATGVVLGTAALMRSRSRGR